MLTSTMSSEKTKLSALGAPLPPEPALPTPSTENFGKAEGSEFKVCGPSSYSSPSRIALEHNYAKLVPFRSFHSTGNKESSFSTVVLFANKMNSKPKRKNMKSKRKLKQGKAAGKLNIQEEVQSSHGEVSNEEGEGSAAPHMQGEVSDHEAEDIIDVTSVDPVVTLPYDERKVSSIMVECTRHVNLVKVPTDISESEALIGRTLSECDYKQCSLLKQLVGILEGDKLARLACTAVPHEPIKRRLNTDTAARRFRKVLATVKWNPKLTRWCHETLLRILDSTLLPIYLDVLQVLKAKCPVLVEHMIHSSMNMAGGEAFALLLKRPWNPAVGLYNTERQVKFEAAPVFVSLPYATTGLGGRRWRMWQSQLSVVGKVFPIILPDSLTDVSLNIPLTELAEHMLLCSLQRVQELMVQFPTRPIILIGFSMASRIAAKIAEILSVSLIISLGLPSASVESTKWKVSCDPFKDCHTPTVFAVGSEGRVSSVTYAEKLRGKMKCPTSLIVVGGGDDLLRLSLEDKQMEDVTQSIVDRCVLDEVYKFLVHILPCSFHFPDDHHKFVPRKRKLVHSEDIGSVFLTPVLSQSPILLTPSPEDSLDARNVNLNNSSPFWRNFLKQSGRVSPGGSLSGSPSPIAFLERKFAAEGLPAAKRFASELIPKVGRPRSKSTADKPKKKTPVRSRSKSSDQTNKKGAGGNTSTPAGSGNTFTPITFTPEALNGNTNNNNSTISPPSGGMLKIPVPHFRPLPITPPRNPYEDKDRQLDPKTLRHLQLK